MNWNLLWLGLTQNMTIKRLVMEKLSKVTEYEKENLAEINELSVSVDDLKKYGVSSEILAFESALRKLYGDEIFKQTIDDDIDVEQNKTVTKVGLNEMNIDNEFKEICDDIDNSEFDDNLDLITK